MMPGDALTAWRVCNGTALWVEKLRGFASASLDLPPASNHEQTHNRGWTKLHLSIWRGKDARNDYRWWPRGPKTFIANEAPIFDAFGDRSDWSLFAVWTQDARTEFRSWPRGPKSFIANEAPIIEAFGDRSDWSLFAVGTHHCRWSNETELPLGYSIETATLMTKPKDDGRVHEWPRQLNNKPHDTCHTLTAWQLHNWWRTSAARMNPMQV